MARRNDHTREELVALTLDRVKQFLDTHSYHELSLRKVATMIGYVQHLSQRVWQLQFVAIACSGANP